MQTLDEKLNTYETKLGESNLYGLVGEINTNGYDMLSRKIGKKFKSSFGGTKTYVPPAGKGFQIGGQHNGFKPMKKTETFVAPLNKTYPGLRLIEKFHPPIIKFKKPSYQNLYGIKGTKFHWQGKKKKF